MAVANSSFHIVVVVDTSQEPPTAHVDVRPGAERNPCCTKWQRSYEKSARDHPRLTEMDRLQQNMQTEE